VLGISLALALAAAAIMLETLKAVSEALKAPVWVTVALLAIGGAVAVAALVAKGEPKTADGAPADAQKFLPRAPASQLPPDIADFTGRETQIAKLLRSVGSERQGDALAIAVITGQPGVGKSALAVHIAHALKESFPDAQLYAELGRRGGRRTEASDVLRSFLEALGANSVPDDIDERKRLYRSLLARAHALVVLDNAEDAEQVRELLPGSATCAVVATGSSKLVELEGAELLELDIMTAPESIELLRRIVGSERVDAEADQAAAITRFCDRLPLALRISAAKLKGKPHWTLRKLAGLLADERGRLDELRVGDRAVRATFQLSYQDLAEAEARAFRLTGLLSAPEMTANLVAAVLGCQARQAEALLERLVESHLLEAAAGAVYRFHDLLRLFARERAETDEAPISREAVYERAVAWYLGAAAAPAYAEVPVARAAAERGAWREAADTYCTAVETAKYAARLDALRDNPTLHANLPRLAARAAYALAAVSKTRKAARLLESTRGSVSEVLGSARADRERLRALGRMDLHERYVEATSRLVALQASDPDVVEEFRQKEDAARRNLDATVREIREHQGLEAFGAEAFGALVGYNDEVLGADAVVDTPIAYAIATPFGGLALLVTTDPDKQLIALPLPELTEEAVLSRAEAYLEAYMGRNSHSTGWAKVLDDVTGWLWGALIGPLLASLPDDRVALVPTGILALLPLHAAWAPDDVAPTGRRYALDEALITYSPRLRVLAEAQDLAATVEVDSLLAVEVSEPRLPWSRFEVDAAAHSVGRFELLQGERATREAVLAALTVTDSAVLHFACHSFTDIQRPLSSGLLLARQEALTLADLTGLNLRGRRLVVLSSSETALGSDLASDALTSDSLTLVAGFLDAGAAGAIGSLWSVSDLPTAALMARFYAGIESKLAPPVALRRAQQWLRDATAADVAALLSQPPDTRIADPSVHPYSHPSQWAAFVYVGA
jgi:CHAT domain-containing protein